MYKQSRTLASWKQTNPIIPQNGIAVEEDTGRYKIGDGVSPYIALSYSDEAAKKIVYDTGWRKITDGVVGTYLLRRVDNRVQLADDDGQGLTITVTNDHFVLPLGFRAGHYTAFLSAFYVNAASGTGQVRAALGQIFDTSGSLPDGTVKFQGDLATTTSDSMSKILISGTWFTDDAWPDTFPGAAF